MEVQSPRSPNLFNMSNKQLQEHVLNLKQKAHKSFLQLMQMEQLHKQELDQLIKEHQEYVQQSNLKQQRLNSKIKHLEDQIVAFKSKQQNSKNSFFKIMEQQNIQPIDFKDDSRTQQSFYQIKEILRSGFMFQQNPEQLLCSDLKELQSLIIGCQAFQRTTLQKFISIFSITKQENQTLKEKINQIERQKMQVQQHIKTLEQKLESKKKQIKFFSQHIRKGQSQKMQLEKKIQVLERANIQNFQLMKIKKQMQEGLGSRNQPLNNCENQKRVKNIKNSDMFKSTPLVSQMNQQKQQFYCYDETNIKMGKHNSNALRNFLRRANENK